jgi:hypothetical protein
MTPQLRCHRCGETIGVYEPVVRVTGGLAVVTSLAREPGLELAADGCYHRACTPLEARDLRADGDGERRPGVSVAESVAARRRRG